MQTLVDTINRFTPGMKLLVLAALGAAAIFLGLPPAIRTMKNVGSGHWTGAGKDLIATICVFIIPAIFFALILYASVIGGDISGQLK